MRARLRMLGVGIVLLLAFATSAAASDVSEKDLGQGFKLVSSKATVIAPHALSVGETSVALLSLIGGQWKELQKEHYMAALPLAGGVLVFVAADKEQPLRIYRQGIAAAAPLAKGICPRDYSMTRDRLHVNCIGYGAAPPLGAAAPNRFQREGPSQVTITRFDLGGKIESQRTFSIPDPDAKCNGASFEHRITEKDAQVFITDCGNDKYYLYAIGDSVRSISSDVPVFWFNNPDKPFPIGLPISQPST